jgi:hypothetical protein
VWVKFDGSKIIDLGLSECGDLILAEGANVFSHACFPDHYTAYALIRDLGLSRVRAVRMLDSDTGFWKVASVVDGNIVGEDFNIPAIAVIMLDMEESVGPWRPGESP